MNDWSDIFKNIAEIIAIIIGGLWVFWKFILNRESESKIEINLELNILGATRNEYILEINANLTNKGLVRHIVKNFSFELRYLLESDPIKKGDEMIDFQLLFPNSVLPETRQWVSREWYKAFVDAGVTRKFTYITYLPIKASYALLLTRFDQPYQRKFMSNEKRILRVAAQKGIKLEIPPKETNKTSIY